MIESDDRTETNPDGDVQIKASDDLRVEGDIAGRDVIKTTTSDNRRFITLLEGGPSVRYAVWGLVIVALAAIMALALILSAQLNRAAGPGGPAARTADQDIGSTAPAVLPGSAGSPSALPAAGAVSATEAVRSGSGVPVTYTPSPTQPPPPAALNLSDSDGKSEYARLIVDGAGVLHVAWSDNSLRREGDIFYRRLAPDGSWSDAESLTADVPGFFDPDLQWLRFPSGKVCLLWRLASGYSEIAMRCREDESWLPRETGAVAGDSYAFATTPAGRIEGIANDRGSFNVYFRDQKLSSGPFSSLSPAFAVDQAGGYHAVWIPAGGGNPYRLAYRYSADGGATWQEITYLETDATGPAVPFSLSLAADPDGGVHLVWGGFHGGIYYLLWTPSGGWQETVTLSPGGGRPQLAVGAGGQPQVVFTSRVGGVFYMAQAGNGAWSAPRLISETGGPPRIALDPAGRAHLVWEQKRDIFYARVP